MLHRSAREGDIHSGRWNGLGGKLEADESPRAAASRECAEEAGLILPEDRYRILGFLQFPNFKAHKNEDWLCWVLEAEVSESEKQQIWKSGPEGTLHWIRVGDVAQLNLWPGDRHFLPWVFNRKPFSGTFWYEAGEVVRSEIYPLGVA
jgi:8-oxo-dGTP diphosphatase